MKRKGVTPYLVEFMKFVCGFALILAVSLTFLYFSGGAGQSAYVAHALPIG